MNDLKQIAGINDKGAQKIIKKREEKGSPFTLEDLKLMSDMHIILWDPLIETGAITLELKGKEYRTEKGKRKKTMSNEQEKIFFK